MARLVVLSEGLTGRSYDLKVEKTTIGRVEDNTFQIPEASVSSHHCEAVLRGTDIVIRDLNSTNGTFIAGQPVAGEAVLKVGQILRLGQVELRLEDPDAKAAALGKKMPDQTMIMPQGVKLNELDKGTRPVAFDKNSPFAKKSNRGTKVFIIVAIAVGILVIGFILYMVHRSGQIGQ